MREPMVETKGGHTIVELVEGLPGELHMTFAEALRDDGCGAIAPECSALEAGTQSDRSMPGSQNCQVPGSCQRSIMAKTDLRTLKGVVAQLSDD